VLTAANAGGYTSTAVRALGALPVYTDVDAASQLATVAALETAVAAIGQKPTAVVVTHLFGAGAEIDKIVAWAGKEGIKVLEDCAQSMGAIVGGKRVGSWGDIATTSFYPTKNLGALGDGGAILTSDANLAAHIRQLRQYGWSSKYRTTLDGGQNSRLDEIQAAILRVKLPYLDEWNAQRRAIHARYEDSVGGSVRMVNHSDDHYVGHLAVLETDDRGTAQSVLAQHGVRTDVHYPIPDHKQPISMPNDVSLPVTERAAERVLSVPLFPELTEREVDTVCAALSRI
jgi:dTDP-4-amino-4,6-dideoxygalactose transaminase